MISSRWPQLKANLSSWFLGIFCLILLTGALISELFQSAPVPVDVAQIYINPIPENVSQNAIKITFKNKLGTFEMEKIQDQDSPKYNTWRLLSPRQLPAKSRSLFQIFETLKEITVRKLHQYEPINISSYSLDNPLVDINIKTAEGDIQIKFGLINPIDNSAYMTVSNNQSIYQIENLKFPLDSFNLQSFIESRIFISEVKEVQEFKIFRGKVSSYPAFKITKTEGKWYDSRDRELDETRVEDFLRKILNLKSNVILDKRDEKLDKKLNRYLNNPRYTIVMNRLGKEIEYKLSAPIRAIREYKIENWKNFVIKASDEEHPYISKREYLNFFQVRESQYKKPNIKKIIY
jgi:hypothetical protein